MNRTACRCAIASSIGSPEGTGSRATASSFRRARAPVRWCRHATRRATAYSQLLTDAYRSGSAIRRNTTTNTSCTASSIASSGTPRHDSVRQTRAWWRR